MDSRFYPETYTPFTFEPVRQQIDIIQTGNKGEGLIAKIRFDKGRIVFAFTGELVAYQNLFTLQIEPGKYLHDPYVMGKVLHSCEPNMHCDMRAFTFTAVRDIEPGEYLTMDYETTEERLFRPFQCCCGSLNCRGIIRGYAHRRSASSAVVTELNANLSTPAIASDGLDTRVDGLGV